MRRPWSTIVLPALLLAPACDDAPATREPMDAQPGPAAIAPLASAASPDLTNAFAPLPVEPTSAGQSVQPAPVAARVQDLPPSGKGDRLVRIFPPEVTAFMVDRDRCDHFRGEEPYDAERRAFLEASINQLCEGTDARLAALRARHAMDPAVTAALDSYDDAIEAAAVEPGLLGPDLASRP